MKNGKIDSFTDLVAWQEGHKLVVLVYEITKDFPKSEIYSLTDQMRRAASSITNNIAEGFGRHSYKEKVQFFYLAKGSLNELTNQIFIGRDVGYLSPARVESLINQSRRSDQLLQGLIKKSKTFISH
ncbi:MAG: four helix bundle protein [Candidatus Levyibacteriota bacterium]